MNNSIKALLGVLSSGVFIWLFLRDKDIGAIVRHMHEADYRYLLAYFVILLLIHVCRVIRWHLLLQPLDPSLSLRRVNGVGAVGFMLMMILPFRLGELARPALIADGGRLSFSRVMPSIVVERVVDGIAIALLLLATLPFVPASTAQVAWLRGGALMIFAIFGGIGALMMLAAIRHDLALKLVHRVFQPFGIEEKITSMVETFLQGLRALPDRRGVVAFFVLTVVYWLLNGFGLGVLAQGFLIQLSLLQMYTVLGVLVIGLMIPAGPGMVGTFQYFTDLGLGLFVPAGVVATAGAAYSNVLWAAQVSQQVLFGLLFLAIGEVTLVALRPGRAAAAESDATALGTCGETRDVTATV